MSSRPRPPVRAASPWSSCRATSCGGSAARRVRARAGRTNLNFHELDDTYQRLLNVLQPGSYIQPHRHAAPPKSESFVVLQGEAGFFCFDEDGRLTLGVRVGPEARVLAVDVRPGVWHTFLALRPDTVVFEGKNGPYDPHTDKTFAPWAPAEADPQAPDYMHALIDRLPAADAEGAAHS